MSTVLPARPAKIGAIIQARMGSERMPGKVLHRVAGKPMLKYLLERLDHCTSLDAKVIATSSEESDTPLEASCREWGVDCFRGDHLNVARRFQQVLDVYHFDAFVRINGDSPLLDQALVDRAVTLFRETGAEVVTNVLQRTFPKGQSVEVVQAEAFRRGQALMREPEDFEHVTRVFYNKADRFRIVDFRSVLPRGELHLAVDTPEQMRQFAALVAGMERPHWHYDLDGIVQLHDKIVGV